VAIVRSTINLAHELGLQVVAEGIEDQATWDLLESLGCDTAQGYLISRPLPAPEFNRWIAESGWRIGDVTNGPATIAA
jgi:EAL domain-containing protein (putative c-di-GMP-specific phosphodiesterase class I)